MSNLSLTEIFDSLLNECEELVSRSSSEGESLKSLIPQIEQLKSNAAKGNLYKLKSTWSTVDSYVLRSFFANDEFVFIYQKVQRELRLSGFLDSSNKVVQQNA